MSILRNGNEHVAYFSQCHMSNFKKGYVVCYYTFNPCHMSVGPTSHVEFKKCLCHPVVFRGQGPSYGGS